MIDKIDEIGNSVISAVTVAVVGSATWFIRYVLTNQKVYDKKIALLEADLKRRDEQRQEDRHDVKEVKDDVRYIKDVLLKEYNNER